MKTTQYSIPALILALFFIVYTTVCFVVSGIPFPSVYITAIFALVCLLMYKQTITVTDTHVSFVQGIGLIRGKYNLAIIQSCNPIRYFPFGWGIRFYPSAILFNVSGNKAVELTFNNGKYTVWIGTKIPFEVAEFINKKLKVRS